MEAVGGVTQAVAVVRHDASGVGQIHGYLTGNATETEVRTALGASLPAFMVPTRIVKLERFPLTPNRKIDRNALPDPASVTAAPRPASAPGPLAPAQSTAGTAGTGSSVGIDDLAAIWTRVLNISSVQPSDNFFDLGGHSLLAIEVHRQIKGSLGVKGLSIADIFRAPTLGGLTAIIERLGSTTASTPKPRIADASRAPEMAQVHAPAQSRPVENERVVTRRREMRASRLQDQ